MKKELDLRRYPFVLHPVPETFVETIPYRKGLFSAQAGLFVIITGDVGVGKSTMLLRMYKELKKESSIRTALIQKPYLREEEALKLLCGTSFFSKPSYRKLIKKYKKGVVMIDEAQSTSPEALALVKSLHDTNGCGVILAGDETLLNRLDASIKSRVQVVIKVNRMEYENLVELLRKRWLWAGGKLGNFPFTQEELKIIFDRSGGNPRLALTEAGNILFTKLFGGSYRSIRSFDLSREEKKEEPHLTPLQREVYSVVKERGVVSIEEIAEALGRSVSSIRARAYELEKAGLIKRDGKTLKLQQFLNES